jgi:hypothetical protein
LLAIESDLQYFSRNKKWEKKTVNTRARSRKNLKRELFAFEDPFAA